MQVVDWKRSEYGPQRKKTPDGRLLHCCCICGKLEPWNNNWTCYASVKELDDQVPIPKFCSPACRSEGGSRAQKVTKEMKRAAKDLEWRDPITAYREATGGEKYNAAAAQQRRDRERAERIAQCGRNRMAETSEAQAPSRRDEHAVAHEGDAHGKDVG